MLKGKSILAIVPARGGSKGVPLKNIVPINGIPLISFVGKVIGQIQEIDRAVVSTDSEEIARVAREAGLAVPFMRPPELSGDLISDLQVLTQALLETEKLDKRNYDIVVMLQPTSPLRKAAHVIATIEKLVNENYDSVWTVSETDAKYHPYKQLTVDQGKLNYYDHRGSGIVARQQLGKLYHRNGVAYAITRQCLLEQKSIKGIKSGAVIISDTLVNIDTWADIEMAKFYLDKELNSGQKS
ncbi:MAG: acylneuraminate cytidylyltransferase family protein [bacterium]|nr:acylneuraminate cytidylyltransferase family protein [bacterium]